MLSTSVQCDRWSELMPIVTWQLWLARQLVAQRSLLQAENSGQAYPWTGGSYQIRVSYPRYNGEKNCIHLYLFKTPN